MAESNLKQRLEIALALNAVIIIAEFIVGLLIHSVSLMSDAGHNFIDQGSLFLTLYAHLLSFRPATGSRTYGFHRAGILAAFLNAFLLLLTAAALTVVAVRRLLAPTPFPGIWVVGTALLAFAANLSIALLLQRDAKHDLNIRGAFWHMLGDAWVSFGVVAGGIVVIWTHWFLLDPLISFLIIGVIIRGAWTVFQQSMEILMEATPPGIQMDKVIEFVNAIPGVKDIHDLHVWTLKPGMLMLTCHITAAEAGDLAAREQLLHDVRRRILSEFDIVHLTVQIETQCCHPQGVHCDLKAMDSHASQLNAK